MAGPTFACMTSDRFKLLLEQHPLPPPRVVHSFYRVAKPIRTSGSVGARGSNRPGPPGRTPSWARLGNREHNLTAARSKYSFA